MSKNIDLRIVKTKKLIKESFLHLMDTKGFESITINEISLRAQINRSTFYLHYTDKYELLNRLSEDALDKLSVLVCPESHIHNGYIKLELFIKNIQLLLETIAEEALFYKAILGVNGIPGVRKKIIDCFKEKLAESMINDTLIPREMLLELTSSIYVDAISWWINNNMIYSPYFMAEYLAKMLSFGPVKLANSKEIMVSSI